MSLGRPPASRPPNLSRAPPPQLGLSLRCRLLFCLAGFLFCFREKRRYIFEIMYDLV